MKIELDISKYLNPCVRKAFNHRRQAFANTVPFILEDIFPDLSILHLDKGRLVLQDKITNKRFKIVCSTEDNSYDLFPSYTKGCKRSKGGVSLVKNLKEVCDNVIFTDIRNVDNLTVRILSVEELLKSEYLGKKGVVKFE
jgi:hypothetical protein